MHINGKEHMRLSLGTNFQFLSKFNFLAPFTTPHKQIHRLYLRIHNVCVTASNYKLENRIYAKKLGAMFTSKTTGIRMTSETYDRFIAFRFILTRKQCPFSFWV